MDESKNDPRREENPRSDHGGGVDGMAGHLLPRSGHARSEGFQVSPTLEEYRAALESLRLEAHHFLLVNKTCLGATQR